MKSFGILDDCLAAGMIRFANGIVGRIKPQTHTDGHGRGKAKDNLSQRHRDHREGRGQMTEVSPVKWANQ